MATNRKRAAADYLAVPVTNPTTPASGDPVRFGNITGVALTAKGDGGNAAADTTVDFSPAVYDLSVKAVNDSGNSAVAVGDKLYYDAAETPDEINKDSTAGKAFGYALETITAGASDTIKVGVAAL